MSELNQSESVAPNIALFIKLRLNEANRGKSTKELCDMVESATSPPSRPAVSQPQHATK
jgi:hypothetical protein